MCYSNSTYSSGTVNTYWFEKNLQGDIIAVYDENAYKLVSYVYDAWGKIIKTDYYNDGASTAVQYNPFRYRGYYYDSELGFYYLNSRYYDPETGRFVNADGYVSTGQGILGYNMFAYCRNEPVFRKDTLGNQDECVEIFDEDTDLLDELMAKPSGSGSGGGWEGAGKSGGHSGGTGGGHKGSYSSTGGGYKGSYSSTWKNHGDITIRDAPEAKASAQMKRTDAVDAWNEYLGPNQTSYNPYKGTNDPDRIFSADGTRSIRFGSHEMDYYGTSKAHFHFEKWSYDALHNTVTYYNTIQRLK